MLKEQFKNQKTKLLKNKMQKKLIEVLNEEKNSRNNRNW